MELNRKTKTDSQNWHAVKELQLLLSLLILLVDLRFYAAGCFLVGLHNSTFSQTDNMFYSANKFLSIEEKLEVNNLNF